MQQVGIVREIKVIEVKISLIEIFARALAEHNLSIVIAEVAASSAILRAFRSLGIHLRGRLNFSTRTAGESVGTAAEKGARAHHRLCISAANIELSTKRLYQFNPGRLRPI